MIVVIAYMEKVNNSTINIPLKPQTLVICGDKVQDLAAYTRQCQKDM